MGAVKTGAGQIFAGKESSENIETQIWAVKEYDNEDRNQQRHKELSM